MGSVKAACSGNGTTLTLIRNQSRVSQGLDINDGSGTASSRGGRAVPLAALVGISIQRRDGGHGRLARVEVLWEVAKTGRVSPLHEVGGLDSVSPARNARWKPSTRLTLSAPAWGPRGRGGGGAAVSVIDLGPAVLAGGAPLWGMGALICRGALMTGRAVCFLRGPALREMRLLVSDMVAEFDGGR